MGFYNLRRISAPLVGAALVIGAVGGLGCRPAAQAPAVLAVSGPRTHPADELEMANRLPDDCLVYLSSESVVGLFEAVGRDTIASRFAEPWERAVFEVVRETGLDPLSLSGLADMGVDVEGEISFALLAGRDPVAVVGLTLADPERFKVALYRAMPRGRHRPHVAGQSVLVGDDDVTVVIDGGLAMVVMGDDADRRAAEIALSDPRTSLARHRPFRVAMRQIKSAPVVRGWLDPRGMAYAAFGLDPRWAGDDFGEGMADISAAAERALKAARERGASAEELVAIDEHYAMAQAQLRGDEEAARLRRMIGGVHGAALSLDISEDGVRLRLRVDADDASLVTKIWRNRAGVPRVLEALDQSPLVLVALSVAPESILEGLALVGLDADVRSGMEALVEGADISELITGELEIAITPPADGALTAGLERLDAGVSLGLRDEARARRLLDDLSALDGSPLARRENGWRLTIPELPPLDVTLTDDRLVLASRPAIGDRLVAGGRGGYEPTRAVSLVDRGGDALSFALAVGLPIAMGTRGTAMWSSSARSSREEVPVSEEYRAKEAELEALDRLISDQMLAAQREERARLMSLVTSLGHVAGRLRVEAHGLDVELRYQATEGTLVDAVADLLQVERGMGGEQMRRLEMSWAARDALAAELEEIRQRDLESAAGKGAGSPKKATTPGAGRKVP